MDIRRLGTRGLANLAYAYLVSNHIEQAVGKAEARAAQTKVELDREGVVRTALREFDEDLERVEVVSAGVDPDRLRRARDNARVLTGLMADMERANTNLAE